MNKTIDNFDQIKSLMTFGESDNLFMHLQILVQPSAIAY